MKRFLLFTMIVTGFCCQSFAQNKKVDSLNKAYQKNKQDTTLEQYYFMKAATVFLNTNVDSGMMYSRKALVLSRKIHYVKGEVQSLSILANYLNISGDLPGSLKVSFEALPKALAIHEMRTVASCYNSRGLTYSTLKDSKKSLDNYYAAKQVVTKYHFDDLLVVELNNISKEYMDMNKLDSAYYFTRTDYDFALKHKVRFYGLLGVLGVFALIAAILLFANTQRKKANTALQKTLSELQNTQKQLIQSEKMASLGELTAGIAHEIQNPLNFVNNFSEINAELIDEMEQEITKGNLDEVKALAENIKTNQQKIAQHGKRADFIVKGMLQHSRNSSGEKQETNLNVLAEEFFKLSYHGLRAKDKSFNAEILTRFDEKLPKINIAQQEIGRVLLNLFNNAFYAVNQKSKTAGPDYKPEVSVSTAFANGQVLITVKDNGVGIPDAIKEKIMQPFFTTKPTGEGTGLGLSLSYDIVVKGHGGKIEIDTKEGEFTEFRVYLPV